MEVIPRLRQNIIILICGLDLGCEILLHWRFRGEWNVVSFGKHSFGRRMMNSSKPLPLLNIKKKTK